MATAKYHREWRMKNPEKSAAYQRDYKKRNFAKLQAYQKAYRAAHQGRHNETNEVWKKNNPELHKELQAFYRGTLRGRYSHCKSSAKTRGIPCTLTFEQYALVATEHCYYCDDLLIGIHGTGLDRIDAQKGYTADNVIPCCFRCNRVKGHDLTVEETKVMVDALLKYRKKLPSINPEISVDSPPAKAEANTEIIQLPTRLGIVERSCETPERENITSHESGTPPTSGENVRQTAE
jgi:hypothetical protein